MMRRWRKSELLEIERIIGIKFRNVELLDQALIHRSYLNEHPDVKYHNERLEFLGDAVLGCIMAEILFRENPSLPEGELTKKRDYLVNNKSLAAIVRQLEIDEFILVCKGERNYVGGVSRGINEMILSDAFEAIIGAIYLDRGMATASIFIEENILPRLQKMTQEKVDWFDPKGLFLRLSQERFNFTPYYQVLKEEGPVHNPWFEVGVFLEQGLIGKGEGKSKKEGEAEAAKDALYKIFSMSPPAKE